jgi:undecaprenyl diphosphate synthase
VSKFSLNETDLKGIILPNHLGVIMDGNGRWAKRRSLPRTVGHSTGVKNFKSISKFCNKLGIKYMSAYAFSTENWKRPPDEVKGLMKLFKKYLEDTIADFNEDNIKVGFVGDLSVFSDEIQELVEETKEICKTKTGMVLNIAMNYGSQDELIRAAKEIANDVKKGDLDINDISKRNIEDKLYTKGQPNLDFVIRTSGEFRISNFMLWQSAYAEYYITDKFWPDFKENDLIEALKEFSNRDRRFGGI